MKKLLALLMAVTLTFQLVTPVFAEEPEETQTATEAVEVETETPVTEIPTTEPPVLETAAPEETSAPTEPQPTTEVTEATASTEETTMAVTEPTEEVLDLFDQDENNEFSTATLALQDVPDSSSEEWLWPVPDNPKLPSPEIAANPPKIASRMYSR